MLLHLEIWRRPWPILDILLRPCIPSICVLYVGGHHSTIKERFRPPESPNTIPLFTFECAVCCSQLMRWILINTTNCGKRNDLRINTRRSLGEILLQTSAEYEISIRFTTHYIWKRATRYADHCCWQIVAFEVQKILRASIIEITSQFECIRKKNQRYDMITGIWKYWIETQYSCLVNLFLLPATLSIWVTYKTCRHATSSFLNEATSGRRQMKERSTPQKC